MSLLTPMLCSSPLTEWFSDAQRVQGMLDFEAALAQAQAACGMVPQAAVSPIVNACQHAQIDFNALGQAAAGAGNLAIPLVKQLTARVNATDPQAARYVHWGATSQDAIDSGFVLQLRGALAATDTLLQSLIDAFAAQAQRYHHTVMPGRTWMQHALPVTFGLKLAGTLDALLRWTLRSGHDFSHLPGLSEGLENRLPLGADALTREGMVQAIRSKRYPYARVNRLLTHTLLDTHAQALSPLPQYACLLGFKRECSSLLRSAKSLSLLPRLKPQDQLPEQLLDARAWDLWALGAGQPFGALYRCQPVIL